MRYPLSTRSFFIDTSHAPFTRLTSCVELSRRSVNNACFLRDLSWCNKYPPNLIFPPAQSLHRTRCRSNFPNRVLLRLQTKPRVLPATYPQRLQGHRRHQPVEMREPGRDQTPISTNLHLHSTSLAISVETRVSSPPSRRQAFRRF